MKRLQFEAGTGKVFGSVNFLHCDDVYAEIEVPAGASEDYGYLTLKENILQAIPWERCCFPYDGQEQHLSPDAAADGDVYLEFEGAEE